MAVEIPIQAGEYAFDERVILEGVEYVFSFQWNARASAWFMTIRDADDVQIVGSVPIRVDTSMTEHLRNLAGMPPGSFVAIDTTDSGVDPGEDELGERVRLIYLTAAEVAA